MPARNVEATVGAAIRGVLDQEVDFEFELVLVDNGSVDHTLDVVNDLADRRLRFVIEPVAGLNRARNAGVTAARAGRVLLCDADDVVERGWLVHLASALEAFECVGGSLRVDTINSASTTARWGGTFRENGGDAVPYGFLPAPYGANCGFRKDVWESLGGFDERLTRGGDDFEFFWRAQLMGYRLGWEPSAIVNYRLRRGWRAIAKRQYRFGRANVELYELFRSHGLRREPIQSAMKSWIWIALHCVDLARGDLACGLWIRVAAKRLGRLRQSLASLTWYL